MIIMTTTTFATATITPEGKTEIKIDGMITREAYVKKLRNLYDKNNNKVLGDKEIAERLMKTVIMMKQNAKNKEDPMELLDITIKTIEKSFTMEQSGSFIFDKDDYAEMFAEIKPSDFMDMSICNHHFNKGKTIAINIAREAKQEYLDMLNEVETIEDASLFFVELEEAKLKYINLFHKEAGYQFNQADEHCKFNWANLIIANYVSKRKFHQPKLHQFKGLIGFIEDGKVKYELFFDTPFKVVTIKSEMYS